MKEKFEANFMGKWITESLWVDSFLYTIRVFVKMVWLPFLVMTLIKVFEINLTPFVTAILVIAVPFGGPLIWCFVEDFLKARKYAKENKCQFSDAWIAIIGVSDELDYKK